MTMRFLSIIVVAELRYGAAKQGSSRRENYASGDRVSVDDALDVGLAIGCVDARESNGGPEACFAGRGPYREVGHSQPHQLVPGQPASAARKPCAAALCRAPGSRAPQVRTPAKASERRCPSLSAQGQKNRAVGQIRPANDVLDPVQESLWTCLKQYVILSRPTASVYSPPLDR